MREKLFKAKRVDTGEWVVGYYCQIDDISYILEDYEEQPNVFKSIQYEVHPETVCQFVKDDLFEGDKLRSVNHYESGTPYYNYHVIQWSEKFNGWFAKNQHNLGKEDTNGDVKLWVYLKNTKFEKIGNIHD